MANSIEVRVHGGGVVCGEDARDDASVQALCALCGRESDVVASIAPRDAAPTFGCAPWPTPSTARW